MAQNETWLTHDLMNPVKVQYLAGNLFSMDNAGNLICVTITKDGVAYSGGGSVSANVIRADGGTVTVSGALSGNVATVVLPQAAYAVPGVASIVVKLTVSGEITTIAAVVANVYESSTDTAIDPGTIIPSIQTLIDQIDTTVASIPADYSSLWTSLAPAFSTSTAYTAGQYVTYNGGLYRFITDHSAGSWSSSDVSSAKLGNDIADLKSAFDSLFDIAKNATWVSGKRLTTGTGEPATSTGFSYTIVPVPNDAGIVKLTTAARAPAASIVFYDANQNYLFDYVQPGTADLVHTITQKVFPGAAYIGITCFEQYNSSFSCEYLPHESDGELKNMISPLYNLGNDDLIYTEIKGMRLSTTGAPVVANGYVCTDFIPAHFGQYIICGVQPVSPVGAVSVLCYDSTKTFIAYDVTRYVKVLPQNTAYIRLTHQSDTLSTFKIKLKTAEIRTAYDPIYLMVGSRLTSGGAIYNDYATGYAISWYIDVSNTPYLSLHFDDSSMGRGAYFYDSNFDFISGSATSIYPDHVKYGNLINVPATAKYMILTTGENFNGWTLSAVCSGYRDVYIGTGRKYTSILQALASERGSVRFFIDSGTYNVVNEYKAFYGNDFWDEYEGYSGKIDVQLRGYTPDYGQEMYFSPGAEIVFDYSGDNENVFIQFSVFNLSINNVIDGAKITFGDHIARYAIHDDMANGMGTNRISNCIFNGTSYNGPVIGGGCGLKCDYYVEHCIFENNDGYADVMYHNSLSAGALNHVHVRDCIGNSGVYFYYLGDSQLVSTFIVSNSKFPEIHVEPHPSSSYPHPYVNVRLVEYCNDKTPVS